MRNILLVLTSLAISSPAVGFANIIVFDNGLADNDINNLRFNDNVDEVLFDDFELTDEATINSASFAFGVAGSGELVPTDTYDFSIWSDDGGAPGNFLFRQLIAVGINATAVQIGAAFGGSTFPPIYQFDLTFPDISLAAGDYWVSFSGRDFFGTVSSPGETAFQADVINGPGLVYDNGMLLANERVPFQLRNSAVPVPEPGTLTLFGLGLAGLGFVRRRQRDRH